MILNEILFDLAYTCTMFTLSLSSSIEQFGRNWPQLFKPMTNLHFCPDFTNFIICSSVIAKPKIFTTPAPAFLDYLKALLIDCFYFLADG